METVRTHVQDSFYALLVTYLKLGSRDILSYFDLSWTPAARSIQLGDVTFNIVRRLLGQAHEIPGVNLVFYEETAQTSDPNHGQYLRLAQIHLYQNVTANIIADERILLKLQRKIDEALYGKGIAIVDFYSSPATAIAGRVVSWDLLSPMDGWQELTDLANSSYLHRAKSLRLAYTDVPIN